MSLKVPDQERLWSDLRQIRQLIETGAPITPEDRLQTGMPVEIRSGPLTGLRGTIQRTASGRRFVVQVDFIQRQRLGRIGRLYAGQGELERLW